MGSSSSLTTINRISEKINFNKNKSVLIAGFPGAGLVGTISTNYMIDKLQLHHIACVNSKYVYPGVVCVEGKLRHSFRLYANNQGTVCIIVCEAPIMINGIHSISNAVIDWAIKNSIRNVLVLDGIPTQGTINSNRIPVIMKSTTSMRNDHLTSMGHDEISSYHSDRVLKSLDKNYSIFLDGISGRLVSACLSHRLSCTAVLILTSRGIPDTEGASLLIESFNEIMNDENLRIDVSELKDQSQRLKNHLKQVIKITEGGS
jgi:uncharacterized protein